MSVFDRLGEFSQEQPHAFLFFGPEGGTQFEAARRLAAAWICHQPTIDGPCGDCRDCASFERGTHPDFVLIAPWGAGRQIRQGQLLHDPTLKDQPPHTPLLTFARTPPLKARTKSVLIVNVEALNDDAANVLLKTLEEPPPFLKFALSTSAVSRIRPTIRSRCLNIASPAQDAAALREKYGELADIAEAIPHLADRFLGSAEVREVFLSLVEDLPLARRGHALRLSDTTRELAEKAAPKDESARDSIAAMLEALAGAARCRWPERGNYAGPFLEAHKRIQGMGHAGLQLDKLFASLG